MVSSVGVRFVGQCALATGPRPTATCRSGKPLRVSARVEGLCLWPPHRKVLLADLEARMVSPSTISKYKLLQRQMTVYGQSRGLTHVTDFNLDSLSRFRATWKDGPRTATKKLERLKAFFCFARERQWIDSNPAKLIRPPKVALCPTLPLEGALPADVSRCGPQFRPAQRQQAVSLHGEDWHGCLHCAAGFGCEGA
jgi:hypothetical protein